MLLTLQAGVFSLDGSEAITTYLSVDLAPFLEVYSTASKRKEGITLSEAKDEESKNDSVTKATSTVPNASGAPSTAAATATPKRRRSMRTYSSIAIGDLSEGAMDAAEKLGIDVAKRLKDLGAGPILKAAKEEVEKGRVELLSFFT